MRMTVRVDGRKILDGEVALGAADRIVLLEAGGRPLDLANIFGCCLTDEEIDPIRKGCASSVSITAGHARHFLAQRDTGDCIILASGDQAFDAEEASFLDLLDPEQLSNVMRAASVPA